MRKVSVDLTEDEIHSLVTSVEFSQLAWERFGAHGPRDTALAKLREVLEPGATVYEFPARRVVEPAFVQRPWDQSPWQETASVLDLGSEGRA